MQAALPVELRGKGVQLLPYILRDFFVQIPAHTVARSDQFHCVFHEASPLPFSFLHRIFTFLLCPYSSIPYTYMVCKRLTFILCRNSLNNERVLC